MEEQPDSLDAQALQPVEIRLAVAENDIDHLKRDLALTVRRIDRDIADTRDMLNKLDIKIDGLNNKLDEALEATRRSTPGWAQIVFGVMIALLASAATLLAARGG